jgi:hypothetical protein
MQKHYIYRMQNLDSYSGSNPVWRDPVWRDPHKMIQTETTGIKIIVPLRVERMEHFSLVNALKAAINLSELDPTMAYLVECTPLTDATHVELYHI